MITFEGLRGRTTISRTLDDMITPPGADMVVLKKHEAARVLLLNEFLSLWPSLSANDLMSLYKRLEWTFKNPPAMTYDIVLSTRVKIQVIPKAYLMQIELFFPGCK